MKKKLYGLFLAWIALLPTLVFALQNPAVAIDFQSINIQDALHIFARQLQQNVVISPEINGTISLHLHNMTVREAFDFVLNAHGLTRFEEGRVWFVLPRTELIEQKQEESKLQELEIATAPLTTAIWQIHYAKAEEIAHLIQDGAHSLLTKRGYLHVDMRTNQLCVEDIQNNINVIKNLVRKIDIPVKQVLIEARLASVDNDFERQLGINFALQSGDIQGGEKSSAASSAVTTSRYGLAVVHLADGSLLDIQLAALESSGHGELISSPRLFTANQQPAFIESGEEIPYQEISRSGATGVAFKKAVSSLKVIPQVLPNNKVLLQLQINQDRPSQRMVLGVPAIMTRQMSTNVLVRNGQTIVLGGIFEANKGDMRRRVPFLSQIPVLGLLFQQQERVENKRELLIFVTPKIIDSA